jgi:dTDP-glucose 4,6-dehydratase
MVKVLLTGGAGFIGHYIAAEILATTDWEITFLDRLNFSGNLNRVASIIGEHGKRCRWMWHDLRAPINDMVAAQLGEHDYIVHLAALTHVDRAIACPLAAVHDNVLGTAHILEHARRGCQKLIYFSTDEVFGPAPEGTRFKEWDRYRSTNPYSATKAGGEELALAYQNTYAVPVVITHTMNVMGERQHPEKFIPSTIRKVRDGEKVVIHADPTATKPGSRFYIHASNVADAVLFLLESGQVGDKYNIVGEQEINNLELAAMIACDVGKTLNYELINFHASRPGHDLRYAMDGSKMEQLGWKPRTSFRESLRQTVGWSLKHPEWL